MSGSIWTLLTAQGRDGVGRVGGGGRKIYRVELRGPYIPLAPVAGRHLWSELN